MLSMVAIATVKTGIKICVNPDLKKEILCAPGSDYDLNKGYCRKSSKLRWYEIVGKKAIVMLENLGVPKRFQEKITSTVLSVGMRMLLWAVYHEVTLGLSREYSVNFLKTSFFTSQGMIDNKMAAEELIKDEGLNIKQKYKLACLYCFTDHITVLFRLMSAEDKKDFYHAENPHRIEQPEFVKFWSYYLMSDIDKLLEGGRNLDQYRLEKAVRSGSKTSVEYCLEKSNIRIRMRLNAVVDAAMEAVRCSISAEAHTDRIWSVRNESNGDSKESWVPRDYYVDILCFLLSKMEEDQKIDFFKEYIEVDDCDRKTSFRISLFFSEGRVEVTKAKSEYRTCFIVLEYFLNWPYQVYFMKSAKLMWEFLPERDYAILLLMICDKIESNYGEGKIYNYRELLKEFWCLSPDRFKRNVFYNQEVTFRTNTEVRVKTGVGLLTKLLTFKRFTYGHGEIIPYADGEIIELILANATAEEKENIFSTKEWTLFCVNLMKDEKWETLDEYTRHCFLSKEEESMFKREFSFKKKAQFVSIDFAKNGNWNAAESFIKWSSLPEKGIIKLKKEMINSEYGLNSCLTQILFDKNVEAVDRFIRWYLPSEEVKVFKKELIFSNDGIDACANFVIDEQEVVTEFINFCLSSVREVIELKKRFAYKCGCAICRDLITDCKEIGDNPGYERGINEKIRFNGGKWEEVEKFLTYCFSSEEEISDFKKNKLLKEYGKEIHFELIISNQWEEAETFFAWLGLSVEELKELKKRTLFYYSPARQMFHDFMFNKDDETFINYGNKQEAIELLLRWYLTDKDMVLEFKDIFHKSCQDSDEKEVVLKNFDLMIEQRLRDLDDKNTDVKRSNDSPLPLNKRLHTLNIDTNGAEYGK